MTKIKLEWCDTYHQELQLSETSVTIKIFSQWIKQFGKYKLPGQPDNISLFLMAHPVT